MKKRIIRTTIGLTALVASFLPQKAQACEVTCYDDEGNVTGSCTGELLCTCVKGIPICLDKIPWP